MAVLAVAKLSGLLVLVCWSSWNGKSALTLLSARWDSLWYAGVADRGYGSTVAPGDGRVLSDLAFFPLFPALEKALSQVLPLSPAHAGLLISAVSSLVAAAGVYALVGMFTDHRTALLTVGLWATAPVSVVQSMAYSESLFTAVAVWSLWFALRERWLAAALLACAAGLTRPVGVAVTLGVWCAVALAVRRRGWSRAKAAALVISPAGQAGYVLWVGLRRGSPFGYLDVQSEWGNGFDAGAAFGRFAGSLALAPPYVGGLALLAGVGVVLWACALGFVQRYPLPVQVYSGVVVLLALGSSGYFGSKPRLLLPAFTLLLPAAVLLRDRSRAVRGWVLAATCLVSAVYGAFWLNGPGPP
ncbi:hypothetical protein JNUCC64_02990 [Streptomyces sp. JNUCC 64]